jgi:ATP-dependent Clp protease ATP-binding subunit ClpA
MRLDQGLRVKNGCPRHEQQAAVLAGLKEKKKKTDNLFVNKDAILNDFKFDQSYIKNNNIYDTR